MEDTDEEDVKSLRRRGVKRGVVLAMGRNNMMLVDQPAQGESLLGGGFRKRSSWRWVKQVYI